MTIWERICDWLYRWAYEGEVIMYGGWVPGNRRDRRKWRKLGMQGEMCFSTKRRYSQLGRGVFVHCDATPELMKKMIDEKLISNPGSWTAYWVESDAHLPRHRQLWGGAEVQLEKGK